MYPQAVADQEYFGIFMANNYHEGVYTNCYALNTFMNLKQVVIYAIKQFVIMCN